MRLKQQGKTRKRPPGYFKKYRKMRKEKELLEKKALEEEK